jgi:hypothetical protein
LAIDAPKRLPRPAATIMACILGVVFIVVYSWLEPMTVYVKRNKAGVKCDECCQITTL